MNYFLIMEEKNLPRVPGHVLLYIYIYTRAYLCKIYYVLVSRNGRVKSHNKPRVNKQPRLFNLAFLTVINVDRRCGQGRRAMYICVRIYPEVVRLEARG